MLVLMTRSIKGSTDKLGKKVESPKWNGYLKQRFDRKAVVFLWNTDFGRHSEEENVRVGKNKTMKCVREWHTRSSECIRSGSFDNVSCVGKMRTSLRNKFPCMGHRVRARFQDWKVNPLYDLRSCCLLEQVFALTAKTTAQNRLWLLMALLAFPSMVARIVETRFMCNNYL